MSNCSTTVCPHRGCSLEYTILHGKLLHYTLSQQCVHYTLWSMWLHFTISHCLAFQENRHYTIKMLNISPYWPQVHQISLQFCCKHKIEQSTKSTCTLTRPWGLADSSFSFSTNLGPSSWNWLWRKHTSTLFIVKRQTGSSQQKWTKPTDRWTQMNKSKARFPKV